MLEIEKALRTRICLAKNATEADEVIERYGKGFDTADKLKFLQEKYKLLLVLFDLRGVEEYSVFNAFEEKIEYEKLHAKYFSLLSLIIYSQWDV